MSADRPILFSGPMVRAILAGEKTQTRRLVWLNQLQPSTTPGYDWTWRGRAPIKSIAQQRRSVQGCWQDVSSSKLLSLCPYGAPGSTLWVRETWAAYTEPTHEHGECDLVDGPPSEMRSDLRWVRNEDLVFAADETSRPGRWRPGIHMPRWASRLILEITEVRVQRLQDIDCVDIRHEGIGCPEHDGPGFFCCSECSSLRRAFAELWDAINGKRARWASNPWVWVISFQRIKQEARAA